MLPFVHEDVDALVGEPVVGQVDVGDAAHVLDHLPEPMVGELVLAQLQALYRLVLPSLADQVHQLVVIQLTRRQVQSVRRTYELVQHAFGVLQILLVL